MTIPANAIRDVGAMRREKEAALLSMGKLMHKLVRDGSIKDDICARLAERIVQIDTEICMAEGSRIPTQGEGVCPHCRNMLASPMAAFCGSCGTNVNEFYARAAACSKCHQITRADAAYCTVCGAKRSS